ncbi:MAG: hypothetical protein J6F31_00730 [Oscillospiraceae bacterium]|nr:hypothetical protein [Oscillospiraceae bacterium]
MSSNKGLNIARAILLCATFTLTTASFILMVIQIALGIKEKSGYIRINEKEELPF